MTPAEIIEQTINEHCDQFHRVQARKIIEALRDGGHMIVPKDPTPEMMRVGGDSMWPKAAYQHHAVENVYRRMCNAALSSSQDRGN